MIILIPEEKIKEIISNSDSEVDALLNLFKEFTPDWEKIESVNQFPQITRDTAENIIQIFQNTGKEKGWNPVRISMLWMNYGWGCLNPEKVKDWELSIDTDKIIYRK